MKRLTFAIAILLLFAAVAGNARGAVYYKLTDLGTLGGYSSAALGVNNSDEVVGASYDSSHALNAFLYSNPTTTDLGDLGSSPSSARGINDSGQIVGYSYTDIGYRAFLYDNGTMTSLGTLSGDADSFARAINDSGQIVGTSRDFSYNAHAFLYQSGTMTGIGALPGDAQSRAYALNDIGQVVGYSYNFKESGHAFLYDSGTMIDLGTLGGAASIARDVNNGGQVVGASYNSAGFTHAFLYENDIMADLGTLGGWRSYARGVNESGQVVGTSETTTPGVYHGFVYSDGTMTDLQSLVDPALGWNLRLATAINDSGAIVGQGRAPSGEWHGFLMTPITRPNAQLSLPTAVDLRMMQNSTTAPSSTSITINEPGNTPTDFTVAASALVVDSASGAVAPAVVTAVPLSLRWTDTATTGARADSVALTNVSDPADPGNHTMSVTGAVVANRMLTVAAVGSSSTPVRIMARAPVTTTIASGANPLVDGDDVATRVNTVAGAKARDSVATVTYAAVQPGGSLPPRFDGANQSASLAVTFSKTGHYSGEIELEPVSLDGGTMSQGFLVDGEAPSVGAQVQSAGLAYDVEVLEGRRLRAALGRVNLGNVLRGAAVSSNFVVTSTNRNSDSQHATMVRVAPGGTSLGELTVGEALVSGAAMTRVPLTGTLNTYGKVIIRGALPVVTAEDVSVQDTTSYRGVTVQYTANVGIAKFGETPTMFNSGGTVLSANVAAGSELTNLSSKVKPQGTLAANLTPASSVTGASSLPATKLYGAVGSEAEIVCSTPVSDDTLVTMQWRRRLPGEAHHPRASQLSTLPVGDWLASDVVKIGGIADDDVYALQMSFDNRINLAFDGPTEGTVANEFPDLFLAQFDDDANRWANAALFGAIMPDAEQGLLLSLSDFLAGHTGVALATLQGSWGVDPSTSATGLGHAWAIVSGGGSGIFAVDPSPSAILPASASNLTAAPEPGTLLLLAMALSGLLAYGWRRRGRTA